MSHKNSFLNLVKAELYFCNKYWALKMLHQFYLALLLNLQVLVEKLFLRRFYTR